MWKRFNGNGGSKTARRGLSAADDLTNAVLATLSDQVAFVDRDGNITAVNEAWKSFDCECGDLGLERSGVGSNYLEVCRAAEQAGAGGVEGAILGLRAVLEGSRPHFSLIYECRSLSGRQWFRMTVSPIGSPPDGAVISHTNVAEPTLAGESLDVAAIAPAETGEPLLRVLTEQLAKTVRARFAFVSEVVDQRAGRLRLIGLWTGERFEEGFEYDVDGTPCQEVLRGVLCLYPADVQKSFPHDVWLKEIAAESYLAVPMFDYTGDVIGHLGVIHDQSLDDVSSAEHVVRAAGARASLELERMRLVRALEKSERTARTLVESSNEGIISTGSDGRIAFANAAAHRMFGYGPGELDGQAIETLVPERYRDKHVGHRIGYTLQPEVRSMGNGLTLVGRRKDGTEFPVEISLSPLEGSDDGQIMAIVSDVTERRQAEEALRESEERYRDLYNDAPVAYFAVGVDGRIAKANRRASDLLGYSLDDLIGRPIVDVYSDTAAGKDKAKSVVERFRRGRETHYEEMEMRRADGSPVWVSLTVRVIRDTDGQPVETRSMVLDISERKQAEEALLQSNQRNVMLIDAIPDMMFTIDRRGVYVDFVPADGLEPYTPPDQFLGRTVFEVLPASLAQDTMRGVELALETGRPERLEYELELDNERRQYEARILKSKDDEVLAIVRDVTAQKRQEREDELRRVRDELEGRVEKEMLGKNPYGLTFREFTVLHLVANGAADKEIADQLGISTFTVSKHVANILGKMAASSRTEACVRALREGLLT
jgi:PAS domain S-box-containing protein